MDIKNRQPATSKFRETRTKHFRSILLKLSAQEDNDDVPSLLYLKLVKETLLADPVSIGVGYLVCVNRLPIQTLVSNTIIVFVEIQIINYSYYLNRTKTKLHGLSPRAN
jgi:hypothetical protein